MKSLIKAEIKDDVVEIDITHRFFVKTFYVREVYQELYKKIVSLDNNINLVLGNPGIGKTLFLQYFLMKLLRVKKKRHVVFYKKSQDTWIHFDMSKNKATVHIKKRPAILDEGNISLVYLLIDAASTQSQTFRLCERNLVVSSPNENNYSDLMKIGGKGKCFYMPSWSKDEITRAVKMQCYVCLEDEVTGRFERFGGIPRIVFELDTDRYAYFCLLQENRIESCSVKTLKGIYSKIDTGKHSHMIFHQVVEDYELLHLGFVSKTVEQAVYDYVDENEKANLEQLVSSTSDSFTKMIFTGLAHHWLLNCKTFSVRDLSKNTLASKMSALTLPLESKMSALTLDETPVESKMSALTLDEAPFEREGKFSRVSKAHYRVLERPGKTIHAYGKSSFFQINMTPSGFILHSELAAAVKSTDSFRTTDEDIDFYFVVQQVNFEEFKFDKFMTDVDPPKERIKQSKYIDRCKLHVIGLNFVNYM